MAAAFTLVLLTAARRDVALRFVLKKGFSRYLGLGLATAYSWLGLAAVLWLYTNSFDTLIHVIFLGFSATMIFTHAPIILPAILRIPPLLQPTPLHTVHHAPDLDRFKAVGGDRIQPSSMVSVGLDDSYFCVDFRSGCFNERVVEQEVNIA
jgi:hypothetical protein